MGVRGVLCNVHVAGFFFLVSPLEIQEQEEQEKGCLMVMADLLDLGHGQKNVSVTIYIYISFCEFKDQTKNSLRRMFDQYEFTLNSSFTDLADPGVAL